ncbi:hypothetical protein [Caldicellulosiruptor morganii]|uniref:Uncharacterized protein n=1 Tax=Caldicellulosiruptor morganii TaxID=1387555 RepID=A0ABY7BLC3_9FIRM|nr:hypothetical protein [Caldicellulosiruptor morganii]WAM32861.1 hypothetical protein OTK00_001312 [Caldicellulosiruptor morganii]
MYISTNSTTTITKEELASICACLAIILEESNFKITHVTKQQNKWKKAARQMAIEQRQLFFRWR